jgi:hypothetical protein
MPDLDTGLTCDPCAPPAVAVEKDLCIYMRADLSDTGPQGNFARAPVSVFWLSPDIELVGQDLSQNPPTMVPGKAFPAPAVNTVTVSFTRVDDCALPAAANDRVRIQLYVADPALVFTPASNSFPLGTPLVVSPVVGRNSEVINWTLPNPPPPTGPQAAGHKCLVARCYPRNLTPDPNNFHVADDPHYAQHNICIVPCSSPCGQNVVTVNATEEEEFVGLQLWADLRPTEEVFAIAMQHLRTLPGFKQISFDPPPPFWLELEDFPDAKIVDESGNPEDPRFTAFINMRPQQETTIRFVTDLEKSNVGDAHILHLAHLRNNEEVIGGLTLLAVRVEEA